MADATTSTEVATYCPLCVSRCGARATVAEGTFTLSRDPSHPTGKVLCVKGKEAPAITAHPGRLSHPMKRTDPTDADDPGWRRISNLVLGQSPSDPISGSSPLRSQLCQVSLLAQEPGPPPPGQHAVTRR